MQRPKQQLDRLQRHQLLLLLLLHHLWLLKLLAVAAAARPLHNSALHLAALQMEPNFSAAAAYCAAALLQFDPEIPLTVPLLRTWGSS
jgi:hypothetical protein